VNMQAVAQRATASPCTPGLRGHSGSSVKRRTQTVLSDTRNVFINQDLYHAATALAYEARTKRCETKLKWPQPNSCIMEHDGEEVNDDLSITVTGSSLSRAADAVIIVATEFVDHYNITLKQLVDRYIPVVTVTSYSRPNAPWFGREFSRVKRKTRRLEKIFGRNVMVLQSGIG